MATVDLATGFMNGGLEVIDGGSSGFTRMTLARQGTKTFSTRWRLKPEATVRLRN